MSTISERIKSGVPGLRTVWPSPVVVDAIVLIGGLLVVGAVADGFTLRLLTSYIALAFMAISLDLVWGYTGILSFGQAAFFGLAAYGFAKSAEYWPDLTDPRPYLIGLVAPLVLAVLLGVFVFYSRVDMFFIAVITLAVGVVLEQATNQFSGFTGGFNGIILEVFVPWTPMQTFATALAIFAVVLFMLVRIVSSDAGKLLVAIRDNEERARFLGFDVPRVKTSMFALSALVCAIGGILYALQTGLVSPTLIGFALATQVIIWTAIGGRATLIGPAVGAIAINYGQQSLSGVLLATWQLALGFILVLIVAFAPEGIYPRLVRWRERKTKPRASRAVSTAPAMDAVEALHGVSGGDALLEAERVSCRFGSFVAVRDVSFVLRQGELVGLIGPNGAGKSTLIDVVSGRTRSSAGNMRLRGTESMGKRPERICALGLARTFQAGTVFDSITVFDNMMLASMRGDLRIRDFIRRRKALTLPAHLCDLLRDSGLDQRLGDAAGALSHGDRKWLELCMVLAQNPAAVLLDEPTAGLTQPERMKIGAALRRLASEGGISLLVVEHDLEFIRQVADRIMVLQGGELVLEGPTSEVVESSLISDIYVGTPQ